MGRSTKSGKREMNPADAYRKEQRKKLGLLWQGQGRER